MTYGYTPDCIDVLGFYVRCLHCAEREPVTRLELKIFMEELATPVVRTAIERRLKEAVEEEQLDTDVLEFYIWDKE